MSSADRILEQCKDILTQRGKGYDNGEQRLMQTIAGIYSEVTQSEFNEFDGYTFMVCLKLARMQADRFTADHYIDLINYVALMGESTLSGPLGVVGNSAEEEWA